MSKTMSRNRIMMIDREADALAALALAIEDRMPQVSELLLAEIARATLLPPGKIPDDVVTMNAMVEFTDEGSGARRVIRLVLPKDADIDAGRLSVLTPIGAGLIGLREGQSIRWPDREGHQRTLTINHVIQAPTD